MLCGLIGEKGLGDQSLFFAVKNIVKLKNHKTY